MLKSIDRYVLKEIASPFGIGLLIYTVTLLLNTVLILSERLIAKDASTASILKILLYLLPDFLAFTIPMATLMGVLAGISRMSTDSEVVALKTLGVNNARLLRPIMLFSVLGWLVSTWLIMFVAPETNFRLNRLNTEIAVSKSVADIKSRVFNKDFDPFVIYFNDLDNNTGEWLNVFLYSKREGDVDTVILAKRGKFFQNPREDERYMLLKDAWVHTFKKREPGDSCENTHWELTKEKVPRQKHQIKQTRRSTQFVFPQLIKKMKEEPKNISFAIEFHRKFALPFACLAMGFLALSLGISTKKGGKVSGFIISLGIIFVYYTIITASQNLVLKGVVSPFVGMWAADIFLLAAGIIAYYYSSMEKTINWEKLFAFVDRIKNRLPVNGQEAVARSKDVLFVIKIRKFRIRLIKILDLYVVKRLTFTFLLIFLSITFVFYIVTIMELVDNVIENHVAFVYLLKYVYYYTPEIIKFVFPAGILTAVLLTFSMMSKNNEIVAVQVSGISLYRLAFPAIILGFLLSLVFFYIQEDIAPGANLNARKTMDIIRNRETTVEMEYNKNWVVGDRDEFYFYEHIDARLNKYRQFNVIYLNDNFSLKKRLSAEFGRWESETELVLENGFERNFEDNEPKNFLLFDEKKIVIPEGRDFFKRKIKSYDYMNIKELKGYIQYLEKNKSDTARYEAQLYNKYAFPFASLVMVLIAIPFSFTMGKKGTLYGIGFAVGLSIIFWGAFGIFSALGSTALLPPFISAFAPLLIFSGFSIYLFINLKT